MTLHLYTSGREPTQGREPSEGWSTALEGRAPQTFAQGAARLDDPAALGAAISGHQGGDPAPAFARERPDLAGIEKMLPRAEGKAHIVVIGNGGSIRNVWALYRALAESGAPRQLHLLDGTDPSGLFGELLSDGGRLQPANTLLVPVSKSGNTENVVQETRLLLERGYPAIAVLSPGESKLAALIAERGLESFPHPEAVGGRFTAGQNSALLPLALAAGDSRLVRAVDAAFTEIHPLLSPGVPAGQNMAKALALALWRAELAGYTELFMPIYAKALSGVGELIVQLIHESYCKGGQGQTVLFAEAPESQHHTNQRYFGGRKNMAGLTVRVGKFAADAPLKDGISAGTFLDLEHAGVVAEAERSGNPHMVLTLDALSPRDVAAAIALFQWAAVYGGILRNVNPFDQPAVEGSKRATTQMFEAFDAETKAALGRFTGGDSISL